MALGNKALKRRQQAADAKAGIVRCSIQNRKMENAKPEMYCAICKHMFLLTKSNADARRHQQGKHEKMTFEECFPEIAKIEADLAAQAAASATKQAPKKTSKKKQDDNLDDLLSAGLNTKKKKAGKGKK